MTTRSPAITRASAADAADLLAMMRSYCDFYEVSPTDAALEAIITALLDDPEHEGVQLIAREAGGSACAFATVYWSWSTTDACRIGVMNDLFVVPGARGRGLADALIDACRAECARHGARILQWQTAPDNARAQAVYDRVGGVRSQWIDYSLAVPDSPKP
jgi:GNAT superfamily N-acetyltransferase